MGPIITQPGMKSYLSIVVLQNNVDIYSGAWQTGLGSGDRVACQSAGQDARPVAPVFSLFSPTRQEALTHVGEQFIV